ncbi:MAG: UTRA domain-containing protein [Cytophagales bacterium]|nr:UTRA domain-containing protein [Cytophagales bacterium]
MPKPSPLARAPYQKIKHFIKHELSKGAWPLGSPMPSEAELVAQFNVSRMTVSRALRELQSEGLVERVQGVGTFAAQLGKISSTLTIRDLHEEIEARGHRHHAVVDVLQETTATPALALQLGVLEGSPVFHSRLSHYDNGLALQCEDRYVNPLWAPDYLSIDFTHITPTAYLLQVAPLWQAQYTIEAGFATKHEAQLLNIDPKDACLIVVRRTLSQGIPITLARLVHPGTRHILKDHYEP